MSLKDLAGNVLSNGLLTPLYQTAGGLSEFYALIFAASGIFLAFRGKLDGNFAAMIVAIQGLLCAHDAVDDFLKHKKEEREQNQNQGK
jgi:hypothetical protein